jgi:hypothetical protein
VAHLCRIEYAPATLYWLMQQRDQVKRMLEEQFDLTLAGPVANCWQDTTAVVPCEQYCQP